MGTVSFPLMQTLWLQIESGCHTGSFSHVLADRLLASGTTCCKAAPSLELHSAHPSAVERQLPHAQLLLKPGTKPSATTFPATLSQQQQQASD